MAFCLSLVSLPSFLLFHLFCWLLFLFSISFGSFFIRVFLSSGVSVKEVILPDMFDEFDGSETLCLAFERGKGKDLTYTDEKKISLNDNDEIIADFTKECLTCDVTLHRDNKTGLFRVRKNCGCF
jgi:hypothetical protein